MSKCRIKKTNLLWCSAQSRLASFKLFFSQFFRGVGDGVTPRISLPLAIWKGLKSFCVGGGRQVGSRCKPNLVFNFCALVKLNKNIYFYLFMRNRFRLTGNDKFQMKIYFNGRLKENQFKSGEKLCFRVERSDFLMYFFLNHILRFFWQF